MIRTFKYRIKDSSKSRELNKIASAVNFVWNYSNQTAIEYLDKRNVWLSPYGLSELTRGCSKLLGIPNKTIETVCHTYIQKRSFFKKRKLSWRSNKRSLGWIPFRDENIKVKGDQVIFYGRYSFRFWNSRPLNGKVKCGSFNQDSKGRWYINLIHESEPNTKPKSGKEIGIDLGIKTLATLSDGSKIARENITHKYANKLAVAHRARKKKQATNIHAKIKNVRSDWNHKQSTKLVNAYDQIIVGNVSPSKLVKTRFAKSVTDASWADFKSMLAYKAISLGVEYKEINEKFSTVTCSVCFERTGPSGLSALGVREWTCKCGATHDRDVNAARNILRFGCESPIKGIERGHQPIRKRQNRVNFNQPLP